MRGFVYCALCASRTCGFIDKHGMPKMTDDPDPVDEFYYFSPRTNVCFGRLMYIQRSCYAIYPRLFLRGLKPLDKSRNIRWSLPLTIY